MLPFGGQIVLGVPEIVMVGGVLSNMRSVKVGDVLDKNVSSPLYVAVTACEPKLRLDVMRNERAVLLVGVALRGAGMATG